MFSKLDKNTERLRRHARVRAKVSGANKEQVGQFASNIRDARRVEPYHGYGVHYADEKVIRKVGKTAAKGKK